MNFLLLILNFLLSSSVVLVSVFLYFKNRNKSNFADEIRIIAFVDVLYLVSWIIESISTGTIVQSASGVVDGILSLASFLAILFCVWKMKDGNTFKSLFKNPGINGVLFFIYMLTNIVIFYQLIITLLNYLIFGIMVIAILGIVDKSLGLSLGTALLSKKDGITNTCSSCARYMNGKCIDSPGAMIDPTNSCNNWRP